MSKKGEVKKFDEVQQTAVFLLYEKLEEQQDIMRDLERQWNSLLAKIGVQLKIDRMEVHDWHLTKELDGFMYAPKSDKSKSGFPSGKK